MNSEDFIDGVKMVVGKNGIMDVTETLINPPGRQPSKDLMEMSKWFNKLSENDRVYVQKIIKYSIDTALFGLFSVLDGVRTIEDVGEKGKFELYFVKNNERTLLNDPNVDFLHDLYNAE